MYVTVYGFVLSVSAWSEPGVKWCRSAPGRHQATHQPLGLSPGLLGHPARQCCIRLHVFWGPLGSSEEDQKSGKAGSSTRGSASNKHTEEPSGQTREGGSAQWGAQARMGTPRCKGMQGDMQCSFLCFSEGMSAGQALAAGTSKLKEKRRVVQSQGGQKTGSNQQSKHGQWHVRAKKNGSTVRGTEQRKAGTSQTPKPCGPRKKGGAT